MHVANHQQDVIQDVDLETSTTKEMLLIHPVLPEIKQTQTLLIEGDTNKCDKIIFRNTEEVECRVKEISTSEIKYHKCGFEDGPIYKIDPNDVSAIIYHNGSKEFFGNYVRPSKSYEKEKKDEYINGYTTWASDPRDIEIFSVLSLVFATLYFIPGLSIVFGVIGLRMFNKEPGRYKGKGFAYAGIILGSLALLLLIVILFI